MKKQYQAFVVDINQVPEKEEIELNIKDLTPGQRKYESRLVKAMLFSSPEELPEGDILWLRTETGYLHPSPWSMKIIQELREYIPLPPYSDVKDKT